MIFQISYDLLLSFTLFNSLMHQVELQIRVLSINGVLGGCVVVKLEGGVDIEGYLVGVCF